MRLALGLAGIDADQPLRSLARALQDPDQRREHEEERPHRNGDAERDPLRVAESQPLRHQLADDHVHERDDQEREHHREHRPEPDPEQIREHLLADGTDRQ